MAVLTALKKCPGLFSEYVYKCTQVKKACPLTI